MLIIPYTFIYVFKTYINFTLGLNIDFVVYSIRDRRVYKEGRLSYADFVWFLISEEDKKTDTRYADCQAHWLHLLFPVFSHMQPRSPLLPFVCVQYRVLVPLYGP